MRNRLYPILVMGVVLASLIVPSPLSRTQAAQAKFRAALIIIQQEGDKGPIDLIVNGFKRGSERLGYVEHKIVYVGDPSQYTSTLRRLAEDGYNVIECTWPPMADAISEVAPYFPETRFVLFDGNLEQPLPNVKCTLYKEDEAAFLAGIIAGKMTKTNRLGFIGNADIDLIHRFLTGFAQGARYVNPAVTIRWSYVGVEDPAKGKETANLYFKQGIDIIHSAASRSSLGVYEAAVQAGKFVIGADADVIYLGPKNILTSVGVFFDNTAELALEEVVKGSFKAGLQVYGLADNGVGLTRLNDALIPKDVVALVEEAKSKLLRGEIKLEKEESYYARMRQGELLPKPQL